MNCTEFRAALEKSIEDRVSLGVEAAGHVEICGSPECRLALTDAGLIDRAIPLWMAQVPEIDFSEVVLDRLNGESSTVSHEGSKGREVVATSRGWQLVAAAAVLVATSVALLSPGGGESTAPVAGRSVPPTGDQVASVSPAHEISQRYVSWAQGQSSLVADAVGAVLPLQSSNAPGSMSSPDMPSSWFERLKPAQRRINAAIMFLEESVQMNENPAT
jgi:hypothetical protein